MGEIDQPWVSPPFIDDQTEKSNLITIELPSRSSYNASFVESCSIQARKCQYIKSKKTFIIYWITVFKQINVYQFIDCSKTQYFLLDV